MRACLLPILTVTRQMKTIAYSLASTKCMEEGWTVRPPSPLQSDQENMQDPFLIEVNPLQLVNARPQTHVFLVYNVPMYSTMWPAVSFLLPHTSSWLLQLNYMSTTFIPFFRPGICPQLPVCPYPHPLCTPFLSVMYWSIRSSHMPPPPPPPPPAGHLNFSV